MHPNTERLHPREKPVLKQSNHTYIAIIWLQYCIYNVCYLCPWLWLCAHANLYFKIKYVSRKKRRKNLQLWYSNIRDMWQKYHQDWNSKLNNKTKEKKTNCDNKRYGKRIEWELCICAGGKEKDMKRKKNTQFKEICCKALRQERQTERREKCIRCECCERYAHIFVYSVHNIEDTVKKKSENNITRS